VGRRQKRSAPREGPEKVEDEEAWSLKDVIFVEDARSVPTGKVIKVDGPYVAVKFNNASSGKDSKDKEEESSALVNDNIRYVEL
jgi:hypothetical protein